MQDRKRGCQWCSDYLNPDKSIRVRLSSKIWTNNLTLAYVHSLNAMSLFLFLSVSMAPHKKAN